MHQNQNFKTSFGFDGGVSVRNREFSLLSKYESPVMIFWQGLRIENLTGFEKISNGFRIENLAGLSYWKFGSFRMVVWWEWYQEFVKFMSRLSKTICKSCHAWNPSVLISFCAKAFWGRYENPVKRWIREPCHRVITKTLGKRYESPVRGRLRKSSFSKIFSQLS